MHHVRHILGAAVVIAAATACGTTQASPPAATSATTPAAAPVTVTSTAAVPTVTTTAANPSAAVAGGRCHTPQLAVSLQGVDGGASNAGSAVVLTNIGSVTCTVFGYPGIGLLTSRKQLENVTVPRGSSYIFQDPKPHTVSLAPGSSASAGFGFLDGEGYGPTVRCEQVSFLQITPPDETATLILPFGANDPADQLCGIQGITALTAGRYAGQSPNQ